MITNNNQNLFANAISIEKMETRLELAAAASKTSATAGVSVNTQTGATTVNAGVTVSF